MKTLFSIHGTLGLAAFLFVVLGWARADDFQGAQAFINQINSIQQKSDKPAAPTQDTYAQLNKDVKNFAAGSASLAPGDAARQWLDLFHRYEALQGSGATDMFNPENAILHALPGPASWPRLQTLVEADPASTLPARRLRVLVHTLNDEEDKQWADLAEICAEAEKGGPDGDAAFYTALALTDRLSSVATQPVAAAKAWDRVLAIAQKRDVARVQSPYFRVPDLVTLLGADPARPVLERILLLPHCRIAGFEGGGTRQLARKIALEEIDKLPQAPWALTESLDGAPLYEALSKKFPKDDGSEIGATYAVIAFAIQAKPKEAEEAMADSNPIYIAQAVQKAVNAGYGMQIFDFLNTYLPAHPDSNLWPNYVAVAAATSESAIALRLVRKTMARIDLTPAARAEVGGVLYRALLGVDKIDAGVAELRALIKAGPSSTAATNPDSQVPDRALQLARLGHLLHNAAWENEGIARGKKWLQESPLTQDRFYSFQSGTEALASFLLENGHPVDAEAILIEAITRIAKYRAALDPSQAELSMMQMSSNGADRMLMQLALVYYNAGRWSDVLMLLRDAPGWNATDLAAVAGSKPEVDERYAVPCIGLMAARALAETGNLDQARKILDDVLQVDGGSDAAYELLLKIGDGDLVAKLDALYRQDQFQERPLIWKAVLLLKQGKVAEAEAACKAAIQVDPSDGEEGKGDRMRVYAVMADVCDAKHDAAQAAFFRNVVKAIRLSEDADDYNEAGLLTRAAGMYDHALTLFSDAYCIQSRLARQLAELGRMDEAAVHYRKAFELMPVSFGRLESHCFGCEGAFRGPTATEIAEKTFKAMLVKDPTKPQLYYLLGYLYMEEERYAESVANFHRAAQLDPDYINAWKNIIADGQNYQLPPALRDEAVLNVIRLDPAHRHVWLEFDKVRQLARLWRALDAAAQAVPPVPASLYPLTGATAFAAAQKEKLQKMLPAGIVGDLRDQIFAQIEEQLKTALGGDRTPIDAIISNGVINNCFSRTPGY